MMPHPRVFRGYAGSVAVETNGGSNMVVILKLMDGERDFISRKGSVVPQFPVHFGCLYSVDTLELSGWTELTP